MHDKPVGKDITLEGSTRVLAQHDLTGELVIGEFNLAIDSYQRYGALKAAVGERSPGLGADPETERPRGRYPAGVKNATA